MLWLAACADKQNRLPEDKCMTQVEQAVFWVKERIWAVKTIWNFWFTETEEWKKFRRESMEFEFKNMRPYHIEWDNVVYISEGTYTYRWEWYVSGNNDRENKLIPIKDKDSFRRVYSSDDVAEMVEKSTKKPTNDSEDQIPEMVVIDGKVYYMWEYFPEIHAKSAFIYDNAHVITSNWVFYISRKESTPTERLRAWDIAKIIPVVKKIEDADPKEFEDAEIDDLYFKHLGYTLRLEWDSLANAYSRSKEYYKADKKNIYFNWEKVVWADVKAFRTSLDRYWIDKNGLYFDWKRINGFNVKNIKLINPDIRAWYFTDGNIVVHWWKILPWCDPKTFRVTNLSTNEYDQISLDKGHVYEWYKLSKDRKPEDYRKKEYLYWDLSDLY